MLLAPGCILGPAHQQQTRHCVFTALVTAGKMEE